MASKGIPIFRERAKNENPVTGDLMVNKAPSKKYDDGWDAIWGKKKKINNIVENGEDQPRLED